MWVPGICEDRLSALRLGTCDSGGLTKVSFPLGRGLTHWFYRLSTIIILDLPPEYQKSQPESLIVSQIYLLWATRLSVSLMPALPNARSARNIMNDTRHDRSGSIAVSLKIPLVYAPLVSVFKIRFSNFACKV